MSLNMNIYERLMARSEYISETGCVEWRGTIDEDGYGHRVARVARTDPDSLEHNRPH